MTRVSKPPPGRPALPEEKKKARNFTFRSRGDMHDRLSEAAARNQRSLSEEIESRLAESFQAEGVHGALEGFNAAVAAMAADWEKLVKKEREPALKSIKWPRRMEITASAQMVDILLGGSKLKSELLRSLAVRLAEVPEDQLRKPGVGLEIWQSVMAEVQKHFAGGSK